MVSGFIYNRGSQTHIIEAIDKPLAYFPVGDKITS